MVTNPPCLCRDSENTTSAEHANPSCPYYRRGEPQITHWEDCYWVHHACAIREVERMREIVESMKPREAPPLVLDWGDCDDDCQMCSGEFCLTHGVQPCDCDTAERHEPASEDVGQDRTDRAVSGEDVEALIRDLHRLDLKYHEAINSPYIVDLTITNAIAALRSRASKGEGDLERAAHLVGAIRANAGDNAWLRDRATEAEREIRARLAGEDDHER